MSKVEMGQSGNSFIDEDHDNLLKHIEEISHSLRNGCDLENFRLEVMSFIDALEDHFSREELILEGAGFQLLDEHKIKHREIALDFRIKMLDDLDYNSAIQILAYARTKILSHELFEDQNYWSVFEPGASKSENLIIWSKDFETGDSEIDKHHMALANFINRLNSRLAISDDAELACRELRALLDYSQFHFAEEEELLGARFHSEHKESHEVSIRDIGKLINEIRVGKFNSRNLGDYLKYWLLNHIQRFDIPAFK